MEDALKSAFLFDLADKYEINISSDAPSVFTDEAFDDFCKEYKKYAEQRDAKLLPYVKLSGNRFRTFLPWQQGIYDTTAQVLWYYDELIIYDPILIEIEQSYHIVNPEAIKERMRWLLRAMHSLKGSIDSGYLLLINYRSVVDNMGNGLHSDYNDLIQIPEIRKELDRHVQVFKMEDPGSVGSKNYKIRSMFRGQESFVPVVGDADELRSGDKIVMDFNFTESVYTKMSVEEVKQIGMYKRVFDSMKEHYPWQIQETLDYLQLGASINSSVLYSSDLDTLIFQHLPNIVQPDTQSQNYYNLALPTVNGIPPERLMEVRNEMPNAFIEFREYLSEIIYDLQREAHDPEIIEHKVKRKVDRDFKNLDIEIQNSLRKFKLLGGVFPVVIGSGMLALWQSGVDLGQLTEYIGGGLGIYNESSSIVNRINERNEQQSNPLYYLWKARKT